MIGLLLPALLGCPKPAPAPAAPVPDTLPEGPQPAKPSMDEEYSRAAVAMMRGDVAGAYAAISTFEADYATSPYVGILLGWKDDLARFGTVAPPLTVSRWVDRPGSLTDHPVTLVLFFEPWCPHCQVEMPAFQPLSEEYAARGLGVLAVTGLTRGATDEMLAEFIEAGGLKFPIGVEDGTMSEAWGVVGVPHAAFVRGGTVVWTGSASLITLDLVDAIVGGVALPLSLDNGGVER